MTTLSTLLDDAMRRARVGSQTLSKLTGIPRTSIDNWRDGTAQRPKHWRPLLQIAQALALSLAEADALLATAGHPPLATLIATVPVDHPDRRYLQPWLEPAPLALQKDMEQRLHAVEARLNEAAGPSARPLHQLRAPVADFVGRAEAIDALLAALRSAAHNGAVAAISGVRGMGGIGKTELAYLVAQRLRDYFPDAQIVLPLHGASAEPLPTAQALRTVIHAFTPDARLPDDEAALQAHYRSALDGRRVLILADDARDAAQVQPLLPPPGCALLITSRQRFSLPGMTTVDLEQLDADAAVTLLRSICERLTIAEAQAIARVCGYLPLALRISASILHSDAALPAASYLDRLTDEQERLRQLRDPDNPGLDVEASLRLSYAQLDGATQEVFRQLGVFVADFATSMALAVVEAPAGVDVEATLRLLLRRNLVMYDAQRGRWRLHDLVRDLARRELEDAGAREPTMWRYARAAVQVAQAAQEQYRAGGDMTLAALARFDAERPHIDASHRWADVHAGTLEGDRVLLDAATATTYISTLRYDAQHERLLLWERVYVAARRLGDQHAEGLALNNLGNVYWVLGDARRAISYYEQRLILARELGGWGESTILSNLGLIYMNQGETTRATQYCKRALTLARESGELQSEGRALINLGNAYCMQGDALGAISLCEQALTLTRQIEDRSLEAYSLTSLGFAYVELGDVQCGIESCQTALTIACAIGDRYLEGYILSYLAYAQARQGNLLHACITFQQALMLFRNIGARWGEAESNWRFGLALAQQGEREQALPLLRTAVTYEQEVGHAKAAEHAALLAHLEAGDLLPAELLNPAGQPAVGADAEAPTDADARP